MGSTTVQFFPAGQIDTARIVSPIVQLNNALGLASDFSSEGVLRVSPWFSDGGPSLWMRLSPESRSDKSVFVLHASGLYESMLDLYEPEYDDVLRFLDFVIAFRMILGSSDAVCMAEDGVRVLFSYSCDSWTLRPKYSRASFDEDEEPSLAELVQESGGRVQYSEPDGGLIYLPGPGTDMSFAAMRESPISGSLFPSQPRGRSILSKEKELHYRRACWSCAGGLVDLENRYGPPSARLGVTRVTDYERANCCCSDIVDQVVYESLDETEVLLFRQLESGRVTVAFAEKHQRCQA